MDLDKAFVSAVLREGADGWKKAVGRGITVDVLAGEGRIAYEYAVTAFQTYGAFPTAEMIQDRLTIDLGDAPASVEYFADEIRSRQLHGDIQSGVTKVLGALRQDPKDALAALETMMSSLRAERLVKSRVTTLGALSDDVWAYYLRIKAGETGILTPWPTMNDMTLGFWPQDLVVVMARQGVGKTWFAVIQALFAWMSHKRVLVATTEISQITIGMRLLSLYNRVAYGEFRKGKLSMYAEEKFQKGVEDLRALDGLFVMGGDFDLRPESLEAAVEETQPDLVIMDGAYLLNTEGANRTEKAAAAFNELKRIAKRYNNVVLATSQFNRSAKSETASTIRMENAGLTDVIGWNADIGLGLMQSEDMRTDKRMMVKPLKVREGFGSEFTVQWDFDAMEFSEVKALSPDADEFGTGVDPGPALTGSDDDGLLPF